MCYFFPGGLTHHRSYSIHIIDTYAGPSYISSVPFNALDLPVRYLQTTAAAKSTSVSIIITCSFSSQFSATSIDQRPDVGSCDVSLLSYCRSHRRIWSKGSPPPLFPGLNRLPQSLRPQAASFCSLHAAYILRHGKSRDIYHPLFCRRNGAWMCSHSLRRRLGMHCHGVPKLFNKERKMSRGQGRLV